VDAEGLAERLALFAPSFIQVPLRAAIVDLEAGRSPPWPGGALPWRISATWPPLASAAQAALESSAATVGARISERASEDVTQPS
jgi:hypothetical protein